MCFIPVMAKLNFQHHYFHSSASHDPPKIICLFAAQELFLIIIGVKQLCCFWDSLMNSAFRNNCIYLNWNETFYLHFNASLQNKSVYIYIYIPLPETQTPPNEIQTKATFMWSQKVSRLILPYHNSKSACVN